MQAYKFIRKGGGRVALTTDPNGANLPADETWAPLGPVAVSPDDPPRIGYGKSADLIAELEAKGITVWPYKDGEA